MIYTKKQSLTLFFLVLTILIVNLLLLFYSVESFSTGNSFNGIMLYTFDAIFNITILLIFYKVYVKGERY